MQQKYAKVWCLTLVPPSLLFCDFKGVVVTPITPTPFLDPQLKVESMVV